MGWDYGDAESDPRYRATVLARLHATARTKLCKHGGCRICRGLPRERPAAPSPENNVLLAMQQARHVAESLPESLPAGLPGDQVVAVVRVSRSRASVDQPRPLCPVPQMEGIEWASVQRLVAHAFRAGGDLSLCTRRTRAQADWSRAFAPNWCRECQVVVLRALGRAVYIAGNEIRERIAAGTRKLARAERSK